MVAYTEFDRPFATSPAIPRDRLEMLRSGFEKMLSDVSFAMEAKKLVDWDSVSFLTGAALQQRMDKIISQPPDVIKRIKDILKETS